MGLETKDIRAGCEKYQSFLLRIQKRSRQKTDYSARRPFNNWKLITQKGPGGFTHWDGNPDEEPDGQLYDLAVDPSEKNNLWDVKPGMVKTLLSMLEVEKANAK